MECHSQIPRTLNLREVVAATGISRATVYRHVGDPEIRFPHPVKFGRSNRWLEHEVRQWVMDRAAKRQSPPVA